MAGISGQVTLNGEGGLGFVKVLGDAGGTPFIVAVSDPLFTTDVM